MIDGRSSPGVVLSSVKTFPTVTYPICTAILCNFSQGPITSQQVNSIDEFYSIYGNINTVDSLSCVSFLQYAQNLLIKRVIGSGSSNASTPDYLPITINTKDEFLEVIEDYETFLGDQYIRVIAQNPGEYGNTLTVALFTKKEITDNVQINNNYKAKDIISNISELHYCIAIFSNNILIESFTVQFNRIKDINDLSKYIYCYSRINTDIYGLYDGNLDLYDGNLDLYNGGGTLYDGNFGYHDGNFCLIDGNVEKSLFCIPVFIQNKILILSGGITVTPSKQDYDDAKEEFENIDNFDIDLCIGNNCSLKRDDVVNVVTTPLSVASAQDFVNTYDIKTSTTEIESFSNIMFLYGMKKINKMNIPLAADYCGQRANKIVEEGLSRSNSNITNPMLVSAIIHNPSFAEQQALYSNQINAVIKEHDVIYCNGEILFRKSAWL